MQNNFSPRDPAKSLFIEQERGRAKILILFISFLCCARDFRKLLSMLLQSSPASLRLRHVCYGVRASVCVCTCTHLSLLAETQYSDFFVTLAASKVWSSWQPSCRKWLSRVLGRNTLETTISAGAFA